MLRAVKVRIYPNAEQTGFLNAQFGAVRFIYNKALSIIRHTYKYHHRSLNANKNIKPLIAVAKRSRKYHWLKQYDSIALQEGCRNLNQAFHNFFKKQSGYPQFKKKHGHQSSYHCTTVAVGDNWISIPKLQSKIKARIHRLMDGQLKSITLSRTVTGHYYAALLFESASAPIQPIRELKIDKIIGIDVGITHLLNLSTGDKVDNPRYLSRAKNNLRRKQKSLSRKIKGSIRRRKARLLLAKCHEKVSNSRNDFQHKVTQKIVDKNHAIIAETLKVKNMLRNRRLSKAISDCAWGNLLSKLSYKAEQSGKYYVKIDTWFPSSKMCSSCGYRLDRLPLQIRTWVCPQCHHTHDRDLNAALNIKKQGIIQLKAEGKSVSASGGLCQTG